jgi:aryl-alcohol dehydrogenase-like predicted oxidoreductase
MDYVRLGSTGLRVSRLALGCMSYGDPNTPGAHPWALDDAAAQPFFQQAVELGITFWDPANTYQAGTSEELVGRAITRYSRREDIVLATKVWGKMHDGPGGQGLSRRAILEQVDASLHRLGTDYIDLYQIHRFDPDSPVEETMEALHDIVKAGKVRYLGASSMHAWQFAKLQHVAALHGWTPFVSMQNQYNLLRRHDEPELMAMCADTGVGTVPYSPQGKGRLARPWGEHSRNAPTPTTSRGPSTHPSTSRSSTRCRSSPKIAGSAWPRLLWPGCFATPSSRHPSSVPPSPTSSRRPSPRSTSTSPKTTSRRLRRHTSSTGPRGSSRQQASKQQQMGNRPCRSNRIEQPRHRPGELTHHSCGSATAGVPTACRRCSGRRRESSPRRHARRRLPWR